MRIRSLKLPEVREVEGAFTSNCHSLVNLELPKLATAGVCFAFNCISLVSLKVPKLEKVDSWFAYNCPSLPPHAEEVLPGKIATTFGKETTKYEDDNLRRSGGPRV